MARVKNKLKINKSFISIFFGKRATIIVSYISLLIALLTFLGISNIMDSLNPKPITDLLSQISLYWSEEKRTQMLGYPSKTLPLEDNFIKELYELNNPYASGKVFVQYITKESQPVAFSITNCSNESISLNPPLIGLKSISLGKNSISTSPIEPEDIATLTRTATAPSYYIEGRYFINPVYKTYTWGFSSICGQDYISQSFEDLSNYSYESITQIINSRTYSSILNKVLYEEMRSRIPLNTFGEISIDYRLDSLYSSVGNKLYPSLIDRY